MKTKHDAANPRTKPSGARRHLLAVLLAAQSLFAPAALAEPPSGRFDYPSFDVPGLSIWDLSGSYPVMETVIIADTPVPIFFEVQVAQGARGKLSGAGPVTVFFQGNTLDGTYSLRGKVRTIDGVPVASVAISVRGSAFIEGRMRNVSLKLNYRLVIDAALGWITGQGRGSVSIAGLPRGTIHSEVLQPLPPDMDGSWRLSLDIDSTGPKLSGTATARLSNGNLWTFNLSGSYSESDATARIRLAGPGGVITLNTTDSIPDIASVTARFLGQSVRGEFVPPWPASGGGGGGGGGSGRLTGSKIGCTGWSFGISGEDFSSTSRQANFQYDFQSRVIREFGTITAIRTGRTYSYDARYTYNFSGCFATVTLTVSGGLLIPGSQTIAF